jgi:hypothetical protein
MVPKNPGAAVPGLPSGSVAWQLEHLRMGQLPSRHAGMPQLTLSKSWRPASWSGVSALSSARFGFGGRSRVVKQPLLRDEDYVSCTG